MKKKTKVLMLLVLVLIILNVNLFLFFFVIPSISGNAGIENKQSSTVIASQSANKSSSGGIINSIKNILSSITSSANKSSGNINNLTISSNNDNSKNIFISQNPIQITNGQDGNFDVEANMDVEIYAFDFRLYYNPEIIEVTKIDEGDFLKKDSSTFVGTNYINNTEGYIRLAVTRYGTSTTGVKGLGNLASISFRAKSPGSTTLEFRNIQVIDPSLSPLTVSSANGNLNVA